MAQHPAHAQNHWHPNEPRPDEIERVLKGAGYPMGKEKLLALAKSNGADSKVMAVLNRMSERNFDSADAVLREANRVE